MDKEKRKKALHARRDQGTHTGDNALLQLLRAVVGKPLGWLLTGPTAPLCRSGPGLL